MNAPTVYLFSKETGELIGSELAVQSPLDPPGVWLEPGRSTREVPTPTDAWQLAVWDGGAWRVEEDHRGSAVYDKSSHAAFVIESIGPVPDTHTSLPPTSERCTWGDGKWVDDPTAVDVPQQISPYQARIALLNAGLLDAVEALMANPATDQATKIAWEYATVWRRDSVFINELAPALALSGAQIDQLFKAGSMI